MDLGIVYLSYGMPEMLDESLSAFLELKKEGKCKISAASILFPEYEGLIEDNVTHNILLSAHKDGKIDYLLQQNQLDPSDMSEAAIRTNLLRGLRDCEYILLVDGDEIYSKESVVNILEFARGRREIWYFDIAFRNYVFDKEHYLDTIYFKRLFYNFAAPNDYIEKFYWDCDVTWLSGRDSFKPRGRIPESVALVEHYSWLNSYGKAKVAYQHRHFGEDKCSFRWNEEKNTLELNEDFYLKYNQPIPLVHKKEQ